MIGLDGAGKSTQLENLVKVSGGVSVGAAYLGYNKFQTRLFRWIVARTEALRSRGYPTTHVIMRLLDFARDWALQMDLKVRMKRAEYARMLVVYDRYPIAGLEPSGNPSLLRRISKVLQRAVGLRVPLPDLVLFLDGDPETLWARKKEYSFETYLETRARYVQCLSELPRESAVVLTDKGVDDSLGDMIEAVAGSRTVRSRLYRDP
jgi:thymidylate kinase